MKSSVLFVSIGFSALLLAACDNREEEKADQKAEQALEYQNNSMGTDKQQMKKLSDDMNKAGDDMNRSDKSKSNSKMMETKPAQ